MGKNQVWAGDITYLKTSEGWMYLAIVMDLYSRRIVGWAIDKHMSTSLISRAPIKAYNLRQPTKVLQPGSTTFLERRFVIGGVREISQLKCPVLLTRTLSVEN